MLKKVRMARMLKVKECPCCGESGPLREVKGKVRPAGILVGPLACMCMGVRCYGCGLEIGREYPYRRPRGTSGMNLKQFERYLLNRAIIAWNTHVSA